jgi:hypothetical protein
MDTLFSCALLAVALAPIGISVRDMTKGRHGRAANSVTAFFENSSTFPSLETLEDLETSAPSAAKGRQWWTE